MIYMKNICCPFMIITAESVAVFVDCDYNSLNCDVTLREHQFITHPLTPACKNAFQISMANGQAGPPGEGEIYCLN